MKFLNLSIAVFIIIFLAACGGGGGGSGDTSPPSQPSNNSPTVNISGATEAESGDVISLTANASDSDGSIASYAWSVDSGSIALTDTTKSQVSFTAPNVDSDTTISLSVTVADNKSATAKATKQISIKKKESLTITGLVLNSAPVPNADITFTVGDSTYSTKANADGQYSITISAGSKNLNIPVVATAVGDATNPTVKLASQLYSVSKLIEQAGSDRTLDANENLSVNISNVTTAEYALLRVPTYWGFNTSISTDEQLQSAQNSIGSAQKTSLAAYSQIVATDSRFKLPDSNKNTLDFIQEQASNDTFSTQVNAIDSALISNATTQINSDKKLVKSKGNTAGQYLLYNLSGANSYRLTLNEDLTGKLEAGNFTTPLKWNQDGSKLMLSFSAPVETGETGFNGRLVINDAELNIYSDYSEYSRAFFKLSRSAIYNDGSQGYASAQLLNVVVYNTAKLLPLTAEKIVGEWMSTNGSYQFNADNTALYKTYNSPNQTTASSWTIGNNKLSLKANDPSGDIISEEIYLLDDLGVGYSYLKISNFQHVPFRFSTGYLVKPQNNLQLKKSDFVGNWFGQAAPISESAYISVMTSDNLMFTSFGAWPASWSGNEGSNSWESNIYFQDHQRVNSCDLSVGTHPDCILFKNYTNKVIAVNGNQYYALSTEKSYENSGEPSINYSLVQSTRLPEITYFGAWITDNAIKVFYQKTADGTKAWNFLSNQLIVSDKSLADSFYPGTVINFSVKNNRLQYIRDNVARELKLINASENGLTVCEYNQGASCVAGTEFLLSNRSPAKITLKVEGSGTISSYKPANPDTLFGSEAGFTLTPDSGAQIKSVTGCGGTLTGNSYVTPEIRDACTITATFSKAPVISLKAGDHGSIKKSSGYEYTISPDTGYMVEAATGCNGILTDGQSPSYAIKDVPSDDCTITVNFKQKLSVEAKIADPGLASCLDASNVKNITQVTQLDCQNDVVSSLEGMQNLSSLNTLTIPKVVSANEIVVPEINSLHELSLGAWDASKNIPLLDVSAIDVSKARNLTHLSINSTKITSLDVSMLFNLYQASVQNNPGLTKLDFSRTGVKAVMVASDNLQELKLPSGVINLFASNNQLTNVDVSGSPDMTWLDLTKNKLTTLNLEFSSRLEVLSVGDNLLTELKISNLSHLKILNTNLNKLQTLDVSKNTILEYLDAGSNQLKDISLVSLENLSYLDISKNQLSSIDLRVSPKLFGFKVESNNLTTLDVSSFTKITELTAFDNKLTTINGLESLATTSVVDVHANSFDANTLAYLNNLKTVKNYINLVY